MVASPALDIMRVSPPFNNDGGFRGSFRVNVFELRHRSGEIMGGRQRNCGCVETNKNSVPAISRATDGNLFYSNIQTCGSVWTCPVCSMKISKQRSLEVAHILKQMQTQKYALGFLTLTWKHNITEELKDVLKKGSKVYDAMTKHRQYKELQRRCNVVGNIRALEVKFGSNGWHPHYHIAIVGKCTPEMLDEFAKLVTAMWIRMQNGNAGENAQKYKPIFCEKGIGEYITKWKAGDEMTKGHMKSRTKGESMTPFGILENINNINTPVELKLHFKKKFKEYGDTMKGRKQLTKGKNLMQEYKEILMKSREKEIEEKTDIEIVNEKVEAEIVLNISSEVFKSIAKQKAQSFVLNEFHEFGVPGIQMLLLELGIFTQYNERSNTLEAETVDD